jgi:hypothetical protein
MGVFLWLSDLHLDPLYGTAFAASHKNGNNCSLPGNITLLEHPYGRVGCDAPLSLVESALQSALKTSVKYKKSSSNITNINIDFVLVTGDFARHSLDTLGSNSSGIDPIGYARTVLSTCIDSIQKILPGVPVLPVLGNNDVVPDYYLESDFCSGQEEEQQNYNNHKDNNNNTHENNVLAMARNGLKDAFLSEEEASTFVNGGYFSRLVEIPSSKSALVSSSTTTPPPPSTSSILVLSLNTVLYSIRHQPDCFSVDGSSREDDPLGQFAWMESQLRRAAAGDATDAVLATKNGTTHHAQLQQQQQQQQQQHPTKIVGVYLAGHIPPSIGSYRHSQLWHGQYLDRYSSILKDYSMGRYNLPKGNESTASHQRQVPPPILGNFFGHVHTEEFRLLAYGFDENDNDEINTADVGANANANENASTNASEPTPMVVPLLVASSITPIYGSNPSYRMVRYDDESGALLDYQTHYLDLGRWSISGSGSGTGTSKSKINATNTSPSTPTHQTPVWTELPGFAEAYGVPDLSPKSFENILANLEEELLQASECGERGTVNTTTTTTTKNSLWETFWNRHNLYSSALDDGDDNNNDNNNNNIEIMIDWLCTMRASSKDDYERCLGTRMNSEHPCGKGSGGGGGGVASSSSSGRTVVILIAANAAALLGVLAWFWVSIRRKRAKRNMYRMPLEEEEEEGNCEYDKDDVGEEESSTLDGVFVIDTIETKTKRETKSTRTRTINTQTAEHSMPTPEGIDDLQGTILSGELA